MATKKDLVEAYSFSRRRLVTAFVSGAPGGREVEPSRPGRTIVGGVALAVLLVAGAAIAGVFAPRTPEDWDQPGLIVSKETGASYVILPPADGEESVEDDDEDVELRPVANTTSAKLIFGADSTPTVISQETIDDQRIGEDIGIFGAPASVPTPELLINSGWTACTDDGSGIAVSVAETPDVVAAPGRGITVENGGKYYAVVQSDSVAGGAQVFPVPLQQSSKVDDQTDTLLNALGLPLPASAVAVPRDWLNLFPVGAPLDLESFPVDDFGTVPEAPLPDGAEDETIGSLLETADGNDYLVTNSGPVALTPFAAQVYRNILMKDGEVAEAQPVPSALGVGFGKGEDDFLPDTGWPAELVTALDTQPCAQLTAAQGRAPFAQLVTPADIDGVDLPPAGRFDPEVEPGRGAYVLSGGWSGESTGAAPYLIDAKGRASPLIGGLVAEQLGYAEVPVPVVPDTWIELFPCGVSLSKEAALEPPTEESECA